MPGANTPCMSLQFRGVRGSLPAPAPGNLRYGGNTTCLEVRLADGQILLIDAGTGLRSLGSELSSTEPLSLSLLFTHFHWDHIQGIPFFTPLYDKRNHLDIYTHRPVAEVREILEGQMSAPLFPVPIRVTPFPMNHPQGASGYRLDCAAHSIVHACDHEPGVREIDDHIARVAEGADVLICDAQYTPEEYEKRRGWGHGTWKDAVTMARRAGVKQLVLTHHDPDHDDAFVDDILARAREEFPATLAASEGLVLSFWRPQP